MPIDSDPSFWKWLSGGIVGTITGGFSYHKYLTSRLDKKADKEMVKENFAEIKGELQYQRETQAKLFDKLDELKTVVLERMPR